MSISYKICIIGNSFLLIYTFMNFYDTINYNYSIRGENSEI